jgi:hypothetical protein
MKKIYTTILFVFAFVALNAQVTIYDSTFDEASYGAATPTNLNTHADWAAGHFNNANTWQIDFANTQIWTGANYAYSSLSSTPITASSGDVITITAVMLLGYNNQDWFDANRAYTLVGLAAAGPPSQTQASTEREGVTLNFVDATNTLEANSAGATAFTTSPTVAAGTVSVDKAPFEVIIEITVGADAASSSKSVRLRRLSTVPVVGTTETTGIRPLVYDALVGSGAYYFNWALGFFEAGAGNISRILQDSLKIVRNGAVLSTNKNNAFEFSMYPNPVKDELRINTKEPLQKIEVFDLLGKSVLSLDNVSESIDVSALTKSLYIVKLTSANGVSTKKFVKQ